MNSTTPNISIEGALLSLLGGDPAVVSVLGYRDGKGVDRLRLYPNQLPGDAKFPAAVYQQTDSEPFMANDGPSRTATLTLALDYYSEGIAEARKVDAAVNEVLSGYPRKDRADAKVVGGIWIKGIFSQGASDEHEPPQDGSERGVFGMHHEYRVVYTKPKPG